MRFRLEELLTAPAFTREVSVVVVIPNLLGLQVFCSGKDDIVSSILYSMANHKANEPRVQLKVPISFRDYVMKEAHAVGMTATDYLVGMEVIMKRTDEKYGVCSMPECIELTRRGYKFCDDHMAEVKDKLVASGNESQESINAVLFWDAD